MSVRLETRRLILREWEEKDFSEFARMNADPLIMEYLPRILDEVSSRKLFERFQQHFNTYGYGQFVIEHKPSSAFLGFAGLSQVEFKMPFTPAVELAWRLEYEYWGQGFASEATQKILEHGFLTLELPEIVAFPVHDNTRAIHVLEKLGFHHDKEGDFQHPSFAKNNPSSHCALYRLAHDEYLHKH